jgi:hypothetical protein
MDITYCNDKCQIGKAAREVFLDINNSAYDAAIDFNFFTDNCYRTCPYKAEHCKEAKENLE